MYGPIIFSAHMNPGTFTSGAYITGFAEFLTNVGDSFTLSDGIFKAPRNGIYEFSCSFFHRDDKDNILAVVKNGAQILKFNDFAGDLRPNFTLTFNWIMELQRGDKVQLQVVLGDFYCSHNIDQGYGNCDCVFNGKLLKNR